MVTSAVVLCTPRVAREKNAGLLRPDFRRSPATRSRSGKESPRYRYGWELLGPSTLRRGATYWGPCTLRRRTHAFNHPGLTPLNDRRGREVAGNVQDRAEDVGDRVDGDQDPDALGR